MFEIVDFYPSELPHKFLAVLLFGLNFSFVFSPSSPQHLFLTSPSWGSMSCWPVVVVCLVDAEPLVQMELLVMGTQTGLSRSGWGWLWEDSCSRVLTATCHSVEYLSETCWCFYFGVWKQNDASLCRFCCSYMSETTPCNKMNILHNLLWDVKTPCQRR